MSSGRSILVYEDRKYFNPWMDPSSRIPLVGSWDAIQRIELDETDEERHGGWPHAAAHVLRMDGATKPAKDHFEYGMSYTWPEPEVDVATSDRINYVYLLKGFTRTEEVQVFHLMTRGRTLKVLKEWR